MPRLHPMPDTYSLLFPSNQLPVPRAPQGTLPSLLVFSVQLGNCIWIGSHKSSLLSSALLHHYPCSACAWCLIPLYESMAASSRILLLLGIEDVPAFAGYKPWSCALALHEARWPLSPPNPPPHPRPLIPSL